MTPSNTLPVWAPRVRQELIRRLYENDAQGMLDEELLDEVGWGLVSRCKSFLAAVEAVRGRAACPDCGTGIQHGANREEMLRCPNCGWENTWEAYFSTIQHKQLSGAEPIMAVFQDFIERFPRADDAQQKMLLIDLLIHSWHWSVRFQMDTRAACVNLIGGNYHQVVEFLDGLSIGPASTPGAAARQEAWREKIQRTEILWHVDLLQKSARGYAARGYAARGYAARGYATRGYATRDSVGEEKTAGEIPEGEDTCEAGEETGQATGEEAGLDE